MTVEAIKRARGRPRDPTKRAALLHAARALFLERGTGAVTLDQVVARAGVSRATLYANFGDKGELLAAVIADESDRIVSGEWARGNSDEPVERTLIRFGEGLLRFVAEADTMAFERLVGQAALAEPAHGTRFFAAGPGRVRGIVVAIIRVGQQRGELTPCDAEQAANDLLGLWQGFWRLEVQYGCRPAIAPAELDRFARHGVRQFLRLYAA